MRPKGRKVTNMNLKKHCPAVGGGRAAYFDRLYSVSPEYRYGTTSVNQSQLPFNAAPFDATRPDYSPHFLDYCYDRGAVYLERPAALKVMSGKIGRVICRLLPDKRPIAIDAQDLALHGRWIFDKVGDPLWRVPRRYWQKQAVQP